MANFRRPATASGRIVRPEVARATRVVRQNTASLVVAAALQSAGLISPVAPLRAQANNPFAGRKLYVDPNSTAKRQAETLRRSRPQDAALLDQIANRPVARWLGGWVGNIGSEVQSAVSTITGSGALPVFVAYNIPGRDCGSYSAGGASGSDAYRRWIKDFANGLRGRTAIVVLEPDALAGMDCLSSAGQADRVSLIRDAVHTLRSQGADVYIDAGNANWKPPQVMADRLNKAGIAEATGFSLNVSNYQSNDANIAYGE